MRNKNAFLALGPFADALTHLKMRHFGVAVLIGVLRREMGFEPQQVKIFISGGLIYDCGMYLLPGDLQQLESVYTAEQKKHSWPVVFARFPLFPAHTIGPHPKRSS